MALLAALKAGGAYLPIAPEWPSERKNQLVEHSGCELVLVDTERRRDELSSLLPRVSVLREHVSAGWNAGGFLPSDISPVSDGRSLAYVMYTSGTTGTPKGVLVEHRSVLNLCRSFEKRFSLGPQSVVLQLSPITFDASVSEVFPTLLTGGCLLLVDAATRLDPKRLQQSLEQHGVTMATFSPSLLAQMYSGSKERPALPMLQHIVVAGECASEEVIRSWQIGRNLVNGYGPTEATVCTTMHQFSSDRTDPTCLGAPIDNMDVYVLDENLKPVGPGGIGELYISGVGLAREYLGQADLTKERFVPNPFVTSSRDHGRMYRSGDWVRVDDDGGLHFVGRRDEQVKIRGHRVTELRLRSSVPSPENS